MSNRNEHGKPRRDIVHGAPQQARAVHEEGSANEQQQGCHMRRARPSESDKIFSLSFFKLLPIIC